MSDFKDKAMGRNGFWDTFGNRKLIHIVLIKCRLNFYQQIPVICYKLDGAQATQDHVSFIYERKRNFVE